MCKVEDAQLYASRPGFRIWKASIQGTVSNTYMFKELLTQNHPDIEVMNYEVTRINRAHNTNQFGVLRLFRGGELVTWNDSCLYVINAETLTVVGSQRQVGFIRQVAVTETEVFVLREGTSRIRIRIARTPLNLPTHLSKYI